MTVDRINAIELTKFGRRVRELESGSDILKSRGLAASRSSALRMRDAEAMRNTHFANLVDAREFRDRVRGFGRFHESDDLVGIALLSQANQASALFRS